MHALALHVKTSELKVRVVNILHTTHSQYGCVYYPIEAGSKTSVSYQTTHDLYTNMLCLEYRFGVKRVREVRDSEYEVNSSELELTLSVRYQCRVGGTIIPDIYLPATGWSLLLLRRLLLLPSIPLIFSQQVTL